jgi:hypothetical protein
MHQNLKINSLEVAPPQKWHVCPCAFVDSRSLITTCDLAPLLLMNMTYILIDMLNRDCQTIL